MVHEIAHLQQVAGLGVDGTHQLLDECGSVVLLRLVVSEVGPCGIHSEFLVLTAAVNGGIVLVDHILALLAVRLHDEGFHLLHSEFDGNYLGDAEECALQDGVGAVAQTNLLSNLGGVDIVYLDVVLGEVALHLVGDEAYKLIAVKNGVEQECAIVAQATCYVVHVKVGLHVASHEVGRVHLIGAVDGLVAEAQVGAGEAARLLGVVGEVGLAILVGVVADNLY